MVSDSNVMQSAPCRSDIRAHRATSSGCQQSERIDMTNEQNRAPNEEKAREDEQQNQQAQRAQEAQQGGKQRGQQDQQELKNQQQDQQNR